MSTPRSDSPRRAPGREVRGHSAAWRRMLPWLPLVARLVLGGVWLWAGAAKATDLDASVRAVRAYRLLPEGAATVIGAGLPWLEIALGLLLVAGVAVRFGALFSAALMVVFLIGIVSAAARGLRIDCGCFGSGGELDAGQSTAYTTEIVRDSALLLIALALARWPRGRLAVDNWIAAEAPRK
ncbi:Methylamine utilisation protein MauE [Cryptosporangium aurantiacum]|uniref:Methylamine utilisation protein MauE n=2 Tax=Cryptosporangium aurantiacum TaxID=134849 RepID=A0A1M7QEA4_9ACTN|nr:DoxX family protein [Cryptosporangium aurantiacum]SHN29022.1 Methylamine utilisation protein MauE [Cryptosporangium aurantiacum]